MDDLGEWIRKIRREVEASLSEPLSLSQGVRLEVERVTLSIDLGNAPMVKSNGVASWASSSSSSSGSSGNSSGSGSGHRLIIDFRLPKLDGGETGSKVAAQAGASVPPPEMTESERRALILAGCMEAFGPRGFDNSARAEVFCELAAVMSASEVAAALAQVESGILPPVGDPLNRPVARLRQLLGFSPIGRERAAGRLKSILGRTPLAELLAVLAEEWRFGTHWPLPESN